MKLHRYNTFINENRFDHESESIEIDGYILDIEDIEYIFSSLYEDIPPLSKSKIFLAKEGDNFEVTFFLDKESSSMFTKEEWFDRFYQTFPQFTKNKEQPKTLYKDKDILSKINKLMLNKIGYQLSSSSCFAYDEHLSGGTKKGEALEFTFTKSNIDYNHKNSPYIHIRHDSKFTIDKNNETTQI